MFSAPLSILLIPYAILIFVIVFFALFNIKNLTRFRAEDVYSFAALFIFLAGFVIIGYFSFNYLSEINWSETVELGINFKNTF